MSSKIQKIVITLAVLAIAGYLARSVYQAGGFRQYITQLKSGRSSTTPVPPVPSVTSTPRIQPLQSSGSLPTTPTPRPVVTTSGTVTQAAAVLSAMNNQRVSAGAGPLSTNGTLQSVAQAHAADMAAKAYFNHTDPQGVTFEQRIGTSGYQGTAEAENIGLTTGSAVEIVDSWMASDAHRLNMLSTKYGAVGVGVASGPWQGHTSTFVVAVFGDKK